MAETNYFSKPRKPARRRKVDAVLEYHREILSGLNSLDDQEKTLASIENGLEVPIDRNAWLLGFIYMIVQRSIRTERRAKDRESVQEYFHSTCVKLFESIKKGRLRFVAGRSSPRGFLEGVVRKTLKMCLRKEGRENRPPRRKALQSSDDVLSRRRSSRVPLTEDLALASAPSSISRDDLKCALSELPERSQYAIEALYFNGKSKREIADYLGISENAVNILITRGLQKMRLKM